MHIALIVHSSFVVVRDMSFSFICSS